MAVQSTETCWLIVSFLLNSKYRENVSQNKSNSIIKMPVKKRTRVEDEKPTGLRVWKSFNGFVTQPPLLLSTCQTLQHPQQGSRHTSWLMGRNKRTNSKPPSLSSPTEQKTKFSLSIWKTKYENQSISKKRVDREIPFIKPTRKSINLDE